MAALRVQLIDRVWRASLAVLFIAALGAFAPGLQAEPFSILKDMMGAGSNGQAAGAEDAAATEGEPPDPEAQQQALERAIELLEDDEARQTLLEDLQALQQGLQIKQGAEPEEDHGALTELSARMTRFSPSTVIEQVYNRWRLLLLNANKDLRWLLYTRDGQQRLALEFVNFGQLLAIVSLVAALSWLLLRIPARRLDKKDRHALYVSLVCVAFMMPFAAALVALPAVGAEPGTRVGVVATYMALGGAGLLLVAAVLMSLAERGFRQRLIAMLLPRVRPWLIAIGASLAAADAFSNEWVAQALGRTLPALLSTWFYMLTALLCGILALRHHRLATMLLRPRRRNDDMTTFWLTAGRVAARSWQWAVIIVSAMSFLGMLLLQGEERTILRSGIVTALIVVVTTLLASLAASWIRLLTKRLRAPPHRSYYLARYMRLVRVLVSFAIWMMGTELMLRAWGSSLGYIFGSILGAALTAALASLLAIALVGWVTWVTLKAAIERALADETENLQSQSARSRTLLPLLRSVGLVVIVIIAVITALSALGVNVTPLLAGAGVLGLAIGFGSQKLVQDLITGLFILFEDTISIGDYIQVAGHEGLVEGLSVRTVRMRDLEGTLHAVPFGEITSVRNLSKDFAYALMNITVALTEDVDAIIQELEAIAEELRKDPILGWDILEPLEVFGLQKFTTDGMVVRVRFKTRPLRQWDVMRGYNLRIKRRFDELGIQLPVQQVMVHQADGRDS